MLGNTGHLSFLENTIRDTSISVDASSVFVFLGQLC
jgi:hypothetical protein